MYQLIKFFKFITHYNALFVTVCVSLCFDWSVFVFAFAASHVFGRCFALYSDELYY